MASVTLDEARSLTKAELNLSDSDVSYITQELLDSYLRDSIDVKSLKRQSVDENGASVENKSYTDYGHNVVFTKPTTYYSNGPQGANYKCGNANRYSWRNDYGDTFSPQGTCSGSDQWYQLYCPSC